MSGWAEHVRRRWAEHVRRRDEERAAALDAAIEYEDAWPLGGLADPGKGCAMDNNEQANVVDSVDDMDQLIDAVGQLRAAQVLVRERCARIAGVGSAAAAPRVPPHGEPGLAEAKAAHAVKGTGRGVARVRSPKEPGQIDEPWKKVKCSRCGAITGSRVVKGLRYPAGHYAEGTQAVCPGRGEVAPLVGRGTIAELTGQDSDS